MVTLLDQIHHPLKLWIFWLTVIHQPVKQVGIVTLQQVNKDLLISVIKRVLLKFEERHNSHIQFQHAATASPLNT